MADSMKAGIIGCGNIAPAYMLGCSKFDVVDVVACADIDVERAKAFGDEHGIKSMSVDKLLADDEIDIVINLTIPKVHAEVSLKIIAAGKHVYTEKPLAITREDGKKVIDGARKAGVLVGCAPDTFLGGGLQTCRKLIDEGAIGRPVAATAFMMSRGPESWHPNPFFFYQVGGGPVLDMAPYYLTALVHVLGPISRVSSSTSISFAEREAGHESVKGQMIPVEVSTHAAGTLEFASGVIGTMIMSFDVWTHSLPRIEIYGSEGTLSVPDPNIFGGEVKLWQPNIGEWEKIQLTHRSDVQRGIGVADMAKAILNGRPLRASGDLAYHVLDLMHAFDDSSNQGQHIEIHSTVERPAALIQGELE